MCGIVGIVARTASVNPDLLEFATKSLAERGPDDSGTVSVRVNILESVQVGLGHQLFLARDPMGIKPLYYFSSDRHFLYASEIRTLLGTGLVPRHIDGAGLINYLAFGSACDPVTLVEGVSALPPGHSLVWENGSISQKMYWDLRASKEQVGGPDISLDTSGRKRIEEEIHAAIAQSIHMHMVSDVPVGVFLSGGIDSSAVTGILSRDGARLNTFSIVFREA